MKQFLYNFKLLRDFYLEKIAGDNTGKGGITIVQQIFFSPDIAEICTTVDC